MYQLPPHAEPTMSQRRRTESSYVCLMLHIVSSPGFPIRERQGPKRRTPQELQEQDPLQEPLQQLQDEQGPMVAFW